MARNCHLQEEEKIGGKTTKISFVFSSFLLKNFSYICIAKKFTPFTYEALGRKNIGTSVSVFFYFKNSFTIF